MRPVYVSYVIGFGLGVLFGSVAQAVRPVEIVIQQPIEARLSWDDFTLEKKGEAE